MKKIIDHHVHTRYSPDADPNASIRRYLVRAKALGLKGMMFTDHVDIDSQSPLFQNIIDYKKYEIVLNELRKEYDIDIYMGVEVGYQKHIEQELTTFLNQYQFDFVIMSMHCCEKLDFYKGDFFENRTQKESYRRYFEAVLESVQDYQNYDVYGHIDYIIRYGNFIKKDYMYDDYKEIIDEILKLIIKNNKGIELNTSGIRYNMGTMHPKIELLKRYKALGGEIITIGSDAHKVEDLYMNIEDGIKLLKKIGFNYVTHFNKRKPNFIKI